uniref:Uncharacterized protein n=1 Tax=Denticeps clupeoides TaxID=299321 RepID=A0AAY4CBX1_9TELE
MRIFFIKRLKNVWICTTCVCVDRADAQLYEWLQHYCEARHTLACWCTLPSQQVLLCSVTLHQDESDFLDKKKTPEDSFCVGLTMIDLHPKDSWNFVFGQASLNEGETGHVDHPHR